MSRVLEKTKEEFFAILPPTIFFFVTLHVVAIIRGLIDFSRQAGGIVAGNEKMLAEIVWAHFWAAEIVLLLLILVYCTARELGRVIGRKTALRLFFGPMPLPTLSASEVPEPKA